jgi:transposase
MSGESCADNIASLVVNLMNGSEICTKTIRERYGVSSATAKRYMNRLESMLPVQHEFRGRASYLKIKGKSK